ncbi:MAG: S41 family peptidase [Bacteroidia bacterium]
MGSINDYQNSKINQEQPNSSSKTNYLLPFLFALFLAVGMILGSNFNPSIEGFSGDDYDKKLNQVLGYIQNSYVDTPNKEELVENAIGNMLQELDPYSAYISAKDLVHANEQLEGNFEGIGVEFNVLHDTVTILHIIPGGAFAW